ncbi:hypothetical protein WKK05_37985 (plasmid) [Nostoc sp. UHCC 0302]|uniref:hypothetical protein n=1 Tax=Nostoc sp. UHCC 0302 TaxID=3134896 RepID=UPI00311CA270
MVPICRTSASPARLQSRAVEGGCGKGRGEAIAFMQKLELIAHGKRTLTKILYQVIHLAEYIITNA